MNKRITESFTKGKAFIPFITCGDPSLEVTEQLVYAMEEAARKINSKLRSVSVLPAEESARLLDDGADAE